MIIVRLIIALPILLLLVLFALSNAGPVQLALWPTDLSLQTPLSVAVLVAAGLFFLLGAIVASLGSFGSRGRARRAEKRVQALEEEVRVARRSNNSGSNSSALATIDG
jgi:putative membrane protein